jgi:hypothetical protein
MTSCNLLGDTNVSAEPATFYLRIKAAGSAETLTVCTEARHNTDDPNNTVVRKEITDVMRHSG